MKYKIDGILSIIVLSPFASVSAVYNRIIWRNNKTIGILYNISVFLLFVIICPFLFLLGMFLPIYIFFKLQERKSIERQKVRSIERQIEREKRELLIKAIENYKSGKLQDALNDLDIILSQNKFNVSGLIYRGMTLQKLEYHTNAISDFDNAIKWKPNEANLYFLRGSSKLQIYDLISARLDIERAAKLSPDVLEYSSNLQIVDILLNEPELQAEMKQDAFNRGMMKTRV